jgi:hypothetical protein
MAANFPARYMIWEITSSNWTSGLAAFINSTVYSTTTQPQGVVQNVSPSGTTLVSNGKGANVPLNGTTNALWNGANSANATLSGTCPAALLQDFGSVLNVTEIQLWSPYPGYTFNTTVTVSTDGVNYITIFSGPILYTSAINGASGYQVPWVIPIQCFMKGTRLAMRAGRAMAIERLRRGDELLTLADGEVPTRDAHGAIVPSDRTSRVVRVVHSTARGDTATRESWPVRLPHSKTRGATADLVVTARHGVLVEDAAGKSAVLVPALYVDGAERVQGDDLAALPANDDGELEWYHVELEERDDLVIAEGVPCEALRAATLALPIEPCDEPVLCDE